MMKEEERAGIERINQSFEPLRRLRATCEDEGRSMTQAEFVWVLIQIGFARAPEDPSHVGA